MGNATVETAGTRYTPENARAEAARLARLRVVDRWARRWRKRDQKRGAKS